MKPFVGPDDQEEGTALAAIVGHNHRVKTLHGWIGAAGDPPGL